MKTKNLITTLAILLVVLISGCKKDTYVEDDGVCPVVESTDPANLATQVPLDKIITVTFNEEMDPATINSSSLIIKGSTQIAGTISYSGVTAYFTPASALAANTTYTGKVKTAVKDLNGNAIQTDYVWTFTTGTTIMPIVVSTDPENHDVNVLLNKTVTASFNIEMDATTLNATTYTVYQGTTPVAGTIAYSGTMVYFDPALDFLPNTEYTCTITTGAKSLTGIALANNYVWVFTTGTLTAPTVISTDPFNNETGVVTTKIITATFSEPMDAATLTATTFTVSDGVNPVTGIVTYAGSTATFTPDADLLSGTTYEATITTGAQNLAGTPLANNYVWHFNTVDPLGPPVVNLQSAERFGILAGVGISNNAGQSEIHDLDVGIYPGLRSSVTGFPPGIVVNGAIYCADDPTPIPAMLLQAKLDLTAAYLFAEAASSPAPITVAGDIGGQTLAPGIYKSTSTLLIQSGDLTLDGQGDANAVWIFQIASGFTTVGGAGGNVILTGGAQAKNVFWQTGSSATIGDYTSFYGNILALTSITMNSHATATGRMLARNSAVTLTSTNIINKP